MTASTLQLRRSRAPGGAVVTLPLWPEVTERSAGAQLRPNSACSDCAHAGRSIERRRFSNAVVRPPAAKGRVGWF